MDKQINTHDDYIINFPPDVRQLLEEIRHSIHEVIPEAKEVISYGMPAFRQHQVLVFYAAFKHHIGFYTAGQGINEFEHELKDYKYSKGGIQFPFNKPIPFDLVKRLTVFRKEQDERKFQLKKLARKK